MGINISVLCLIRNWIILAYLGLLYKRRRNRLRMHIGIKLSSSIRISIRNFRRDLRILIRHIGY